MNKKNKEKTKELKEFTATDVKNIYESVDIEMGFDLDFAIWFYRQSQKEPNSNKIE